MRDAAHRPRRRAAASQNYMSGRYAGLGDCALGRPIQAARLRCRRPRTWRRFITGQ